MFMTLILKAHERLNDEYPEVRRRVIAIADIRPRPIEPEPDHRKRVTNEMRSTQPVFA